MTETAYSTSDPATVAAFKATADAFNDCGRRSREDAEKLGKNKGALIRRNPIFGVELVGLAADDPKDPPQGWRCVRGQLEPRRGKPGESARQWLADHQPPDLRKVLAEHGLPRYSKSSAETMGFRVMSPRLLEHDGTIWALYQGVIEGECTWEPRKLSEYHGAREACEAAEQAAVVPA